MNADPNVRLDESERSEKTYSPGEIEEGEAVGDEPAEDDEKDEEDDLSKLDIPDIPAQSHNDGK